MGRKCSGVIGQRNFPLRALSPTPSVQFCAAPHPDPGRELAGLVTAFFPLTRTAPTTASRWA